MKTLEHLRAQHGDEFDHPDWDTEDEVAIDNLHDLLHELRSARVGDASESPHPGEYEVDGIDGGTHRFSGDASEPRSPEVVIRVSSSPELLGIVRAREIQRDIQRLIDRNWGSGVTVAIVGDASESGQPPEPWPVPGHYGTCAVNRGGSCTCQPPGGQTMSSVRSHTHSFDQTDPRACRCGYRLSDLRSTNAVSESQFQAQVVTLAESLGWEWMHVGRTGKYQANGAKGTLGTGWPDLTLVRGERMIFVELKSEKKQLTEDQRRVHDILQEVHGVYVFRPSDWNLILEVLA